MDAALHRYRLMAYVVGVVLLLLVVVAMPLKYLAHKAFLVEAVGPVHGVLFMVYLALAYDLARRRRWGLGRMAFVMLAGTIPVLSFVAERSVTREVAAGTGEPLS